MVSTFPNTHDKFSCKEFPDDSDNLKILLWLLNVNENCPLPHLHGWPQCVGMRVLVTACVQRFKTIGDRTKPEMTYEEMGYWGVKDNVVSTRFDDKVVTLEGAKDVVCENRFSQTSVFEMSFGGLAKAKVTDMKQTMESKGTVWKREDL